MWKSKCINLFLYSLPCTCIKAWHVVSFLAYVIWLGYVFIVPIVCLFICLTPYVNLSQTRLYWNEKKCAVLLGVWCVVNLTVYVYSLWLSMQFHVWYVFNVWQIVSVYSLWMSVMQQTYINIYAVNNVNEY